MSIRPEWVAKILNGEKTIEIRKKFSKDYVGWVYIYCTKKYDECLWYKKDSQRYVLNYGKPTNDYLNGKVVARFWCNKVEPIAQYDGNEERYFTKSLWETELFEKSCLDLEEMRNYIHNHCGYAIHITKLEIFGKPKELWQFKTPTNAKRYEKDLEQAYEEDAEISARLYEGIANDDECANCVELTELSEGYYGLQRPPQSWCYVEVL